MRASGPLDVLVVNAGIVVFGDALEHAPDDVDRLFRINLLAPFHAAVEEAIQMPDGGRIILCGNKVRKSIVHRLDECSFVHQSKGCLSHKNQLRSVW